MILLQNSPFSQEHQKNLEVLNYPLGSDVAACNLNTSDASLGSYFISEGERYIDLSYNHLYNPLGHNHPIDIKQNWTLTECQGYTTEKISKSDEEGNFIQQPEQLFIDLRNHKEVINVQNFHGQSFELIKDGKKGKAHPIFHYLNYYVRLKIFEEGGLYQLISEAIDNNLKVGSRKGLVIHFDKSPDREMLASKGLFVERDQSDMLFIPLAIHIQDVEYIVSTLNEESCFN